MVMQLEKALYVFEFQSTKSVTTVQWGFRRMFHKNPPGANSIRFLASSCRFIVMQTVALLVAIVGITSVLRLATNIFLSSLSNGVSFVFVCSLFSLK
jgi:hypothetical protein